MTTVQDLDPKHKPQWCPGCGNYGIVMALKQAIVKLNYDPEDVVVVSGIGCSGKTPHYLKTYGFESIHGRAIPPATAIKFVNSNLHVFATPGDGDCYGIGLNHFIHAARRNVDITVISYNNHIYALTKGQTSPTTRKGTKTNSTPHGAIEMPINPIALAIASDGTFAARGFAADIPHLTDLIVKGSKHRGFSVIDVLQPCVSYNTLGSNAYDFLKERCYKLEGTNYKPNSKTKALEKAYEWGDKIPIGLFYQEKRPTYSDELPQLKKMPLFKQRIDDIKIDNLIDSYL